MDFLHHLEGKKGTKFCLIIYYIVYTEEIICRFWYIWENLYSFIWIHRYSIQVHVCEHTHTSDALGPQLGTCMLIQVILILIICLQKGT